jgi:hypothetical protein
MPVPRSSVGESPCRGSSGKDAVMRYMPLIYADESARDFSEEDIALEMKR